MKQIAESVQQPITYSRLLNVNPFVGLKIGKSTIIQYIDYFKNSYLLFSLSDFGVKFVEKIRSQSMLHGHRTSKSLLHRF